ncbi:exported hypothetical protein [Candidatus Sulfotelmatomonas gaucii]|uniref:TonB-dependent receptor plug domain-containing protein n=1 Tax=Candidatus Sulfuritelmatomonas gaucii TaxID=2043161 RepID=A0A2N9M4J8_9BACT|nr:exported hypothetical protein [Candidatus Sulfotelmatomonas gaucii]
MPTPSFLRSACARVLKQVPARFAVRALAAFFLVLFAAFAPAASIRGVVTDATGAKVTGAAVSLFNNGKVIASAVSSADGSFEILTGASGRFFLVVSARSFRQLQTPDFYASQFASVEHNIVLEPDWVRESIVVTATGTPTPQPQTSAATTVLSPLDLALPTDLVSALRLMPGTFVVQTGQRGAQASLFVRGGDSDDNKILIDGVDAGDLGGRFDFGPLSTAGVESAEVYRGPDSNLILVLYQRRALKVQRSIADRIPTFTAPALTPVSSASPPRTARPASLPCSSKAMPGASTHRTSNSRSLERTASLTTSAPSVGCRPPIICRWTSRILALGLQMSAYRSTPQRSFAGRSITAWHRQVIPTRGTSIMLPTTPRKRTRISSPAAPSTTRPHRVFTRVRATA